MNELKGARRDFSRIGIALFLVTVATIVLVQVAAEIIAHYFGDRVLSIPWVLLCISGGVQYLITMPAAFLIIRGMKKQDIKPFGINFGKFCILFLICYFLMYAGNLMGIGTTLLLQHTTDSMIVSDLGDVFSGINLYVYILFVVILAPIIEELFFRKLLITRMERYGEAPAIIVSGLLFGIIHGNFTQGFYAVMLGIILGYIYIRTRKIIVTIGLHMLINLFGGVIIPIAAASGSLLWESLAGLLALGFAIAGLVMFILRIKKVKIVPRENQLTQPGWGEAAFANVGMILFFAAGAAAIVFNTLNMMVPN